MSCEKCFKTASKMLSCDRCCKVGKTKGGHTCDLWENTRWIGTKNVQEETFLFRSVAHGEVYLSAQLEWARKARIEKAQEAGWEKAQAELRKQDANQLKRMHALETDGLVTQAQKKAHAEHLLSALTDGQPSSSSSSMGTSCQLCGGAMVERANTITKVVFLACSQFEATGCNLELCCRLLTLLPCSCVLQQALRPISYIRVRLLQVETLEVS